MKNKFIITLGTAQDGGYPHVGCFKECCLKARENIKYKRYISSIAIIDSSNQRFWIIDITPDFNEQLSIINKYVKNFSYPSFSGIFLTHAHIGHYAGLVNLGLEAMNLKNIPVYVFPRMKRFLSTNTIFKQLIVNKNIIIQDLNEDSKTILSNDILIKGFNVPHRNELSETVGYNIISNDSSIIYLPDIDSWTKWDNKIINLVKKNDILIVDVTFYTKKEILSRDITKIPHPSIKNSLKLLKGLNKKDKNKIFFTHLNHTNPVLDSMSYEYKKIITSGYNILKDKQIFKL